MWFRFLNRGASFGLKTCSQRGRCVSTYTELYKKNFVNNEFVKPKLGLTYENFCPLDGRSTGNFALSSGDDTLGAIQAAYTAFEKWGKSDPSQRSKYLTMLADKMEQQRDEIAQAITLEMGKPIREAKVEVDLSVTFARWFAEQCHKIRGEIMLSGPSWRKQMVVRKPHGVVGLISPWNHPLNMIVRSQVAAMAAGCTIVIKPSPETPLVSLILARLCKESDIPPGVINVITTDNEGSPPVGNSLCFDSRVRHISFTGSTTVGKILMKNASTTVKRCSMELGGNSPFIVFKSADLDRTIACLKFAKFRNTGQTCTSPNRIFVHSAIMDEFLRRLTTMVSELKIVSPFDEECEASCLYNSKGYEKVKNIVEATIEEGASVHYQTKVHEHMGPNFFPPTILTGCKATMPTACEEIFGPVMCIYEFEDTTEVIKSANLTKYGLAGYVYTRNSDQVVQIMNDLECGVLAINDNTASTQYLPFGGVKESGIGRELGMYGMENYMDVQSIIVSSNKQL